MAATRNAFDSAGRKVGDWSEPDAHGGVMVGEYVDGDRQGLWRHFFADGRLRSQGEYRNGALHGKWTWYRGPSRSSRRLRPRAANSSRRIRIAWGPTP